MYLFIVQFATVEWDFVFQFVSHDMHMLYLHPVLRIPNKTSFAPLNVFPQLRVCIFPIHLFFIFQKLISDQSLGWFVP